MAAPVAQSATQGSLTIDVIMLDGRMIAVPYLDFHTIKDLLDQLLATETPENRRRYAINEFRRSGADSTEGGWGHWARALGRVLTRIVFRRHGLFPTQLISSGRWTVA